MGFDIKSILSMAGDVALSFVPGASPVVKGLAGVAKLIGGNTGKKIEEGLSMVSEGLAAAGKQPLSPEQQVELEKNKNQTEVELKEIAYKDKKLIYDDQSGGREIVKTALLSDDPLVRQARPKMMLLLGKASIAYTIGTPLFIGLLATVKVDAATIGLITNMILWQGGTLWTAFTTSFTGYTVGRSVDKRSAAKMQNGEIPSKLMEMVSKIGKSIS